MLRVFRVDIQVLGNLLTKRDGRRAAISVAISLAFLGAVSLMFGQVLRHSPDLLRLGDDLDVAGMSTLFAGLLMPALLLTMWFGLGGGRRQLFERPQLDLLLSAPVHAAAILAATR